MASALSPHRGKAILLVVLFPSAKDNTDVPEKWERIEASMDSKTIFSYLKLTLKKHKQYANCYTCKSFCSSRSSAFGFSVVWRGNNLQPFADHVAEAGVLHHVWENNSGSWIIFPSAEATAPNLVWIQWRITTEKNLSSPFPTFSSFLSLHWHLISRKLLWLY